MKEFLQKALIAMIGKVIEQYVTEENIAEWELAAKKFAYEKLKELAASTDWTDIDDNLVEKIGQSWGVA